VIYTVIRANTLQVSCCRKLEEYVYKGFSYSYK
jgi:hypothetical protein